jgi:nucleoside-diphosphate-sugar epimerase
MNTTADTTVNPIYLVGGGKGGVGKSVVALALVDHLQRRGVNTVLVENDTSNPDVMRVVHDEMDCASFDLDTADGWIDMVNYCDGHRDAVVVVSTAARNQDGVTRYGATLGSTLDELGRRLVVLWVR